MRTEPRWRSLVRRPECVYLAVLLVVVPVFVVRSKVSARRRDEATTLAARARRKLRAHQAASAVPDARRATQLWPEFGNMYVTYGDALEACGRTEEAISAYRAATRAEHPERESRVYVKLALVLERSGRQAEARVAWQEVLHAAGYGDEKYADMARARLRARPQTPL